MIPIQLSLSGFLSYRDPVEIDFTSFDLACIAGPNGAGKSSLLDAITWALFGQARKRDDAVINTQSAAAEVSLVFGYEGNFYRVQRLKPREKTMMLEFHILLQDEQQPTIEADSQAVLQGRWKPLTERTLRETEARIEQTLRLDYDTFVNASFFLQGKADQFTQQRPGDRKRILSNILGLEVWEVYKQGAAERRRQVEVEIEGLDGRLQEIVAELAEEAARKQRLETLQADLARLAQERAAQEALLANVRQIAATLAEQERLVDTLARQLESARRMGLDQQARRLARSEERQTFAELLGRAEQVQANYAAWQAERQELERLEEIAGRFRQHEKRREAPRAEILAERARLEQEMETLRLQQQAVDATDPQRAQLAAQIEAERTNLAAADERLARRAQLEVDLQAARQNQVEARAENTRLKPEMDELKERIEEIRSLESATCPLCGQALDAEQRQALVAQLEAQGRQMGDQFRANQAWLREADARMADLQAQINELSPAENARLAVVRSLAQLESQLQTLEAQVSTWEQEGARRLQAIDEILAQESYAPEARARLAEIDAELKATGYDAAAHDSARQAELDGRASEAEMRTLEKAQAALAPLEREITELDAQIAAQQQEIERQEAEHRQAADGLAAARAQAPDLYAAEQAWFASQEQENQLRMEVGMAQQKVLVLDDLKARRKNHEAQREALAQQVRQYKQLERAFGKDGVPALLIEQALPEIEGRANELLDRLSGGNMSVRFVTQAAYKDKRREDLKETLDIQISDSAGRRDYEMFSGGEAFRVNFAIRLALSEVLAQRAGARLQTLVIDEGFGSQDAQGRQRLIEAINLVRADFAKVLVITHIEELKDAFPNRIDVEKTERGSVVRVI
ncbi:MAG: SMC family ATPase [Chloroflexota bacterium]